VLYWLPLAVVQFVFSLILYTAGQQDLRQSANDPQIQIAEDAAAGLAAGQPAQSVLLAGEVDLRRSLAPFMIIYDQSGTVVATSALLSDRTPALPSGVLPSVLNGRSEKPWNSSSPDESRFTWQPDDGVRCAVVVRHYASTGSGFVLVGRSLREVERREDQLLALVIAVAICADRAPRPESAPAGSTA
jgi:hypothetical protein